jgi:hypothetical protein
MRRLEFSIAGIDRTTQPGEYMSYNSVDWRIMSIEWDLKGNVTSYVAETGDW